MARAVVVVIVVVIIIVTIAIVVIVVIATVIIGDSPIVPVTIKARGEDGDSDDWVCSLEVLGDGDRLGTC